MKDFIEKVLHQKVRIRHCDTYQILPLILRKCFEFYQMEILNQFFILAEAKENISLSSLRKQHKQLEQLTGKYCVLYLKHLNSYARDKLVEEGIPFIWDNRQIYIPAIGMLLTQGDAREIKPCSRISFLTQKFILSAIYGAWDEVSVTEAAEKMGVSKMSITRTFDEIESLNIPILAQNGKRRKYIKIGSKKEIWDTVRPFLRSPLLKEYRLEKPFSSLSVKSGISGLAEMSMLEDDVYVTYAATKREITAMEINNEKQVPSEEVPGCVVHEVGYSIPFCHGKTLDPLSIFMLLEDIDDPRVQIALDKMLEDYVW